MKGRSMMSGLGVAVMCLLALSIFASGDAEQWVKAGEGSK